MNRDCDLPEYESHLNPEGALSLVKVPNKIRGLLKDEHEIKVCHSLVLGSFQTQRAFTKKKKKWPATLQLGG